MLQVFRGMFAEIVTRKKKTNMWLELPKGVDLYIKIKSVMVVVETNALLQ